MVIVQLRYCKPYEYIAHVYTEDDEDDEFMLFSSRAAAISYMREKMNKDLDLIDSNSHYFYRIFGFKYETATDDQIADLIWMREVNLVK